jgi:predicted transcriptional regulator of viral defense system
MVSELEKVYEVMKQLGTAKVGDIWDATGLNPNTIRNSVRILTISGLIERVEKGTYRTKTESNSKKNF